MGNKNSVTVTIKTPRVPVSVGEIEVMPDDLLLKVKKLLTVAEVAGILRCSARHVQKMAHGGQLEGTEDRPMRISSVSVVRHLEAIGLDPADL